MTPAVAHKISFFELATQDLKKAGKPMTAAEIWNGFDKLLKDAELDIQLKKMLGK
jgi:hypothetical protein